MKIFNELASLLLDEALLVVENVSGVLLIIADLFPQDLHNSLHQALPRLLIELLHVLIIKYGKTSFVFVCLSPHESVVGLFLHLFGLQLIVLVHSFPHLLQTLIFASVLENHSFSLGFHLLGEEPILLGFQVSLHGLFEPLLFLFLQDLFALVFVHTFPVIRQDSVSAEARLASPLNDLTSTVFSV